MILLIFTEIINLMLILGIGKKIQIKCNENINSNTQRVKVAI